MIVHYFYALPLSIIPAQEPISILGLLPFRVSQFTPDFAVILFFSAKLLTVHKNLIQCA